MQIEGWIKARANVVFMGGLLLAAPPQRCTLEGVGWSDRSSRQAGEEPSGEGAVSSGGSGSGEGTPHSGGGAGALSQAGAGEQNGGSAASGVAGGGGETVGGAGGAAGSGAAGSGPAECPAGSFEMVGRPGCFECPGYTYDSGMTCAMLSSNLSEHFYDSASHKLYLRAGEGMPAPKGWGTTLGADVSWSDPDFDPGSCEAQPLYTIEGDYYVADFSPYFACSNQISGVWVDSLWPDYGCATYIEDYSEVYAAIDESGQGEVYRNCKMGPAEPPIAFGNLTPYPRPARYDASNPLAVKDNETGLFWEQRPNGFYARDTQTEAVNRCDFLDYAGYTDWRLPTVGELLSIVRFDLGGNHLDPVALPFNGEDQFWSSSALASDPEWAHLVSFSPYASYDVDPVSVPLLVDYWEMEHAVRCVRGGHDEPALRYTDSGNGTIRDNRSGLTWEKAPTQGSFVPREAQSYCQNLALAGGGWRVPTIHELVGLSENAAGFPTMDAVFQSVSPPSAIQWSSTIFVEADYTFYDAGGWLMASDGSLQPEVGPFPEFARGDVRCVR